MAAPAKHRRARLICRVTGPQSRVTMGKLEFCEKFIWLKNKPISFVGRSYLREPYASQANKLVIRASRQVEKSTFLVNTILYMAVQHPGIHILFVCPRQEQAQVFSRS